MKRPRIPLLLLALVIFAAAIAAIGLLYFRFEPAIKSLMRPALMDAFRERLRSIGPLGAAVLAGAQFLQVVSGVAPALPIQIAAGLTYGALPGLLICLTGILAGSSLVFAAVKKFGRPAVDKLFPPEKQQKLAFLTEARRLEAIVFILYLIPAMPKDVLTYLAGLTPLSLRRYLAITLTARTPTILCSTLASGALMEGDYAQAAVIFSVTAALGILCMLLSPKILKALERHGKKR